MDESNRRIVILGKTGSGKSSLCNTILGEKLFSVDHSLSSETIKCQTETRRVKGRSLTLIDTPGFLSTDKPKEELKPEILRCITECAPGPHAFLIVLKVERFTAQEEAIIKEVQRNFSEAVFRYGVVVFTHGDNLQEEKAIQDMVSENKSLSDLVEKCGRRCHVFDNKYWNNNPEDEYRNNKFQVGALLITIDKMIEANNGCYYTNEMLQQVEREIQKEQKSIRWSTGNMSEAEGREKAKKTVLQNLNLRLAAVTAGAVLGAFMSIKGLFGAVVGAAAAGEKAAVAREKAAGVAAGGGVTTGAVVGAVGAAGAAAVVGAAIFAAGGATGAAIGAAGATAIMTVGVTRAVIDGSRGYHAAGDAETPWEAAMRAMEAVKREAQHYSNMGSITG